MKLARKPSISGPVRYTHADLPGVEVLGAADIRRGQPQTVVVRMQPHAVIPRHTHRTDATMIATSGSACVLSDDPETHEKPVAAGDIIFFPEPEPHGFRAGPDGFVFVSQNGGIVADDENGEGWDIDFAEAA